MKDLPIVSVIVPNYNHGAFLEKRIESILNQRFQDFELIILDDSSVDNSIEVIKKYESHPKVSHIYLNKSNSGNAFGLWKYGIEKAKGKFVWIAESDDWAHEDFLLKIIPLLKESNSVICHSNSIYYKNGELIENNWWHSFNEFVWDRNFIQEGKTLLKKYGRYKCPVINVSSAVFKKSIIKDFHYPINFKYCGDWWFWVNVFAEGKVSYVAKPLNVIRIHPTSVTQNKEAFSIHKLKEDIKVIRYANILLGESLYFSKDYEWIIDFWISIFENNSNFFSTENHFVNLPFSFKVVFYRRFFKLFMKRIRRKTQKIKSNDS